MDSRFQSIPKNVDLVQQVVDQLKSHISDGTLPIGEVMPSEAEMTQQFGVSRTVTREAIRTLRALGLVEVSRGRRPRVSEPDADTTIDSLHLQLRLSRTTLLQQIEVRTPVECCIAELAAQRRSADHLTALQQAIADLRNAETNEQSADADLRFHRTLAAATGNFLFESVLGAIGELMRQSMGARKDEQTQGMMIQIHQDVLDAVARGDATAAREAMRRHMEEATKILVNRMDGEDV